MNVAIIPARGGSRRIPRKNIRMFHGKPIITYSIEAAKASGLFDMVIVSTDDDEIARIALNACCGVFRRDRPDDGERGTQEVTAEALRGMANVHYACCIYATAPMLGAADLRAGAAHLSRHPFAYVPGLYYWGHADSLLSGVPLTEGYEVPFPPGRYIDINTEDDWRRAEEMYASIHAVESR